MRCQREVRNLKTGDYVVMKLSTGGDKVVKVQTKKRLENSAIVLIFNKTAYAFDPSDRVEVDLLPGDGA